VHRTRIAAIAIVLVVITCTTGQSEPPKGQKLARQQVVTFAIPGDYAADGTLDPENAGLGETPDIASNVFGGLYRYDDAANEVPDIADGPADVSTDGLSYTFHLRPAARFSNGDPVTAGDFVFSWTRAARDHPENFFGPVPISGFDAVAAGRTSVLSGVTAVDDRTLRVSLTQPGSYWVSELWQPCYWVVDQRVVEARGADKWWSAPDGLVGTGAFRMSAHNPGVSIEFEPVPNWWGGAQGRLAKVVFRVIPDPAERIRAYNAGGVQVVLINPNGTGTDLVYYRQHASVAEMHAGGPAQSQWLGFDLVAGAFAGLDAGRDGRLALSLAIDRKALQTAVCGLSCEPATGGLILKGLHGYLGDGADTNARFDPEKAKALLNRWDVDGSKLKNLKYSFNFNPFNLRVARELQRQWRANLGLDVEPEPVIDTSLFAARRAQGEYALFRGGWRPDYNSPAEWLDPAGPVFRDQLGGFSDPKIEPLLLEARSTSPESAQPLYNQVGQRMVEDVAYAELYYTRRVYLWKPSLRGLGSTAFVEHSWTELEVLEN
jgi:oligopeptide transport system substrate-binding protein